MKSHLRTTFLFGKGPSYSALFHSTPAALHRRRNSPKTRFHNYSGRFQREYINVCTDSFFKRWEANVEDEPSTSRRGDSWYRQTFTTGASSSRRHGPACGEYAHRFEYYWDDAEDTYDDIEDTYDDIGDTFRSDFGGPQFSFGPSLMNLVVATLNIIIEVTGMKNHIIKMVILETKLQMNSDRLALGLNASGPLHLEDVKNAYRSCALKWHPDRHQGSSKAVAEEKLQCCISIIM